MPNRDLVREDLLRTDDEFRRLHDEHHACETKLLALHSKSLPSQEDETTEKQLKLHKLALKDRMEQILHLRADMGVPV